MYDDLFWALFFYENFESLFIPGKLIVVLDFVLVENPRWDLGPFSISFCSSYMFIRFGDYNYNKKRRLKRTKKSQSNNGLFDNIKI